MPIRVVPIEGGAYEVIDGFKRLRSWMEQGYSKIPSVIEVPGRPEEHKRLLLLANAPPRTLTAMDEAEVVQSMKKSEGLSEHAIGRELQKKPEWVQRRITIAQRLATPLKKKLAQRILLPSVAHRLCTLEQPDQIKIVRASKKHRLNATESHLVISAYRAADATDRLNLLKNPRAQFRSEPPPTVSPDAIRYECRLENIQEALHDLINFRMPTFLSSPELRRIEAIYRVTSKLLERAWKLISKQDCQQEKEPEHVRQQRQFNEDQKPKATSPPASS